MESTYDVAFFKVTQLLLHKDQKLTSALEDIEYLDFSQIGLPLSIQDERSRVYAAISVFERIGSFRTPAEKLDCLLNTIFELTKDATSTFLDSDSLIPLLLMTLIRSKVPHLTANLVYMKDYTFERNIVTGKYGYALSTFEGVLDYIVDAHLELQQLSQKNLAFWSAIETGDLDFATNDTHDVRDLYGNDALMIACMHHQSHIAHQLLSGREQLSVNDMKSTPLMLSIKHGKQLETVKVLLRNQHVVNTIKAVDNYGNTAILYACEINNLEILKALHEIHDFKDCINTMTGDTILHVAARSNCSLEFLKFIVDHCNRSLLSVRNKKNETFLHLCRNEKLVRYLLLDTDTKQHVMDAIDNTDRSPLMTWASRGRLDLMELVIADNTFDYSCVDKYGYNILHLLALHLNKGFTLGEKSLDFMLEKLKGLVHVCEWTSGNTPLHIAAETSTLASPNNVTTAVSFIRSLVKYGATLDATNFRDESPVNVCRVPQIIELIDG